MKLKPFLLLISVLILLTSTQFVSALELRTVIKEQLIESQYGAIGDFFGIGDRLYRVTYEGGAQERVWKKSSSLLSKATITQTPSDMIATEGQAANYSFMVQAPNLPRFTGGTGFAEHKFMIYDDTGAQQELVSEIIDSNIPTATPKSITFKISNTSTAGKRFYFMKEFVKDKTTGTWVSGAESQSSEWRFEINILLKVVAPVETRTIQVDTAPTNSSITYLDAVIGTTAKNFTLETGQTKILVFKQEGYVTMMKGISSSTTTIPRSSIMSRISNWGWMQRHPERKTLPPFAGSYFFFSSPESSSSSNLLCSSFGINMLAHTTPRTSLALIIPGFFLLIS